MPRPTRSVATLVAALGTAVLVTGCTSSSEAGVDLEGLDSGPCSALVGTLEDVDNQLRGVADDEISPEQAAERFLTVQDDLAAAEVGSEVQPAVTELITSLGFFRVSVDSNSYDDDEATRVRTALAALAEDCRTA